MKNRIAKLNFDTDDYMIVGSGILDVLGIRRANDVDLLISKELFAELSRDNRWNQTAMNDGSLKLTYGNYDCMMDWYGRTLSEMLPYAEYISDVPYLNLQSVIAWKNRMGRDKDIQDLALIDNYLIGNSYSKNK